MELRERGRGVFLPLLLCVRGLLRGESVVGVLARGCCACVCRWVCEDARGQGRGAGDGGSVSANLLLLLLGQGPSRREGSRSARARGFFGTIDQPGPRGRPRCRVAVDATSTIPPGLDEQTPPTERASVAEKAAALALARPSLKRNRLSHNTPNSHPRDHDGAATPAHGPHRRRARGRDFSARQAHDRGDEERAQAASALRVRAPSLGGAAAGRDHGAPPRRRGDGRHRRRRRVPGHAGERELSRGGRTGANRRRGTHIDLRAPLSLARALVHTPSRGSRARGPLRPPPRAAHRMRARRWGCDARAGARRG